MYILERSSELLVDTYVVYLVLPRVVRRYPGYLVYPFVGKDATSNDKTIQGTKVSKPLTIITHLTQSLPVHHLLVAGVVFSDLGILVTLYSQWAFILDILESVIEVMLVLFVTVICRSMALYDVQLEFLMFYSKNSFDDPWPM